MLCVYSSNDNGEDLETNTRPTKEDENGDLPDWLTLPMVIFLMVMVCFFFCTFLNWFAARFIFVGEPPEGELSQISVARIYDGVHGG